jgi:hypothetical protein
MKKLFLVPCLLTGLHVSASADDGINILNNMKFNGEIRPRYENADVQNDGKKVANAYTARTTIGIGADLFQVAGLSAYLEGTSVNNFGSNDYNSGLHGNTHYDIIADPQQARMTQAYVDYKINKTLIRAGRQTVNLDNQRFIGSVDWRQMPQTFDAVAVVDNTIENLSLLGAYVYGVNGVKSESLDVQGDNEAYDTSSVLLHASYKVNDMLNVTAYDYMLASISDTYGAALTGKVDIGAAKLDYRAEYAKQNDATIERRAEVGGVAHYKLNGKPKADAQYYNLDVGANVSGILAGLNYEYLSGSTGSDDKTAFQTPLATLHAFNGWADVFLGATPSGGLIDKNVRLGYEDKTYGKILAVYHKFDTDKDMPTTTGTSKDLGSEFDVSYGNKIPGVKNLTGLIKGAMYKGGDFKTVGTTYNQNDKNVLWLQLDYKFATK